MTSRISASGLEPVIGRYFCTSIGLHVLSYLVERLLERVVLVTQLVELVSERGRVVDRQTSSSRVDEHLGRRRAALERAVLRLRPHRPRVRLLVALQHLQQQPTTVTRRRVCK